MEKLEMLYDHYKETFKLNKEAQSRRNKNFIILSSLEAFLFFLLIRPEKAFELRRCGQFLGPKGTRRRKTWHIRNKKKNELSPYMMN